MKILTFEYGEIPPISGDFYDENFPLLSREKFPL
jgi:hypothetical protein